MLDGLELMDGWMDVWLIGIFTLKRDFEDVKRLWDRKWVTVTVGPNRICCVDSISSSMFFLMLVRKEKKGEEKCLSKCKRSGKANRKEWGFDSRGVIINRGVSLTDEQQPEVGFGFVEVSGKVYKKFVEVGRVALINVGPDAGKICVIVDVVDNNRALVDCAPTGVTRAPIAFKAISLTDMVVPLKRGMSTKYVTKAFNEADCAKKWEQTAWAKKRAARVKRANMTDFCRFKLMLARKQKAVIVGKEFAKLKKKAMK
eukprot:Nk52_evm7s675 gene=Nk52_evmTU7s675